MVNKDFSLIHELREKNTSWEVIIGTVDWFTDNDRKLYAGWLIGIGYYTNRLWLLKDNNKPIDRVVGVIGDIHLPFELEGYLPFIIKNFIKHKVTDIVFIGDLIDNHAISRHINSTSAMSPVQEYELALEKVKKWTTTFPKAKLCIGNHDSIPSRQLAELGIPPLFLKDYKSLWNLPKEWEIDVEFVIDDVNYFHGLGSMSKDGALNTAIFNRISTVQGHSHSYLGCKYLANKRDTVFGMNVGCGIDVESYAMEYGKNYIKKPTLGCGVVYSSVEAYAIPFIEYRKLMV